MEHTGSIAVPPFMQRNDFRCIAFLESKERIRQQLDSKSFHYNSTRFVSSEALTTKKACNV
jgi:hypothetical protein